MESDVTGQLVAGRYRLGAVIGRGGMGVVWQARDELLGRDVAVKELTWPRYLSAGERQAARRRAIREARAAARLSHPNVIRVFDVLEEDGFPWIVMELLAPRSLRDVTCEEGPLSPARAAQLGLEILGALRAAHALGIVHRDVKPANILVAPDRAVLVDFGIAQAAESSVDVTTASMLIGSPAYVAPERARGGTSGPAADLWGLGASLYAAVEGWGPFERDGGALASLSAVIADEPEPAAHAGPLWPVISGLLHKDPDVRLDADQAERMLRLVRAEDSSARTADSLPPPLPRRRPRLRRRRAAVGALVGSAALAVAAVSATVVVLDHPSQGVQGRQAGQQPAAAAAPTTAAPSTRPSSPAAPGTGTRPAVGATPGTHLAARTSPAPAASAAGSVAGSAGSEGKGKSGKTVPPGHSAHPGKPGKGNGKG